MTILEISQAVDAADVIKSETLAVEFPAADESENMTPKSRVNW